MKRLKVSNNVIRRLPRYLRKLDDLAALNALCEKTGEPIPKPLANLTSKAVNFNSTATPEQMHDIIREFVKK